MRIGVLYHDHCFDGAASAAYFSRFLRDRFYPDAEFTYHGMAHKASQLFEDSLFEADETAIVDFKYAPHPRLTWWFDHHQSAFLSPEDAEHFRQDKSGKKLFDPSFRSCTRFIATVARERFGYEAPDLAELVEWADVVDGAQFSSAEEAVSLASAALKLTLVIEGVKGSDAIHKIIRWMQQETLDQILEEPEIQAIFVPLYEKHLASMEIIRKQAVCHNGVVYFDLTEYDLQGYNKFIPYHLYPAAAYSVSVSIASFRTKVSVGSNPWAPVPLAQNLATICERYGGGGHARVGAISFEKGAVEAARRVAKEIVDELKAVK